MCKTSTRVRQTIASLLLLLGLASRSWAVDQPSRVASETVPVLWSRTYEYDGAGNIAKIDLSGTDASGALVSGSDLYLYDAVGRLVNASVRTNASPLSRQVFTYDRYGNLTQVITETGQLATAKDITTFHFGVDPQTNRLTRPCAPNESCLKAESYDSSGNVTGMPSTTLTWDALGALAELQDGTLRHEQYLYDADGERVATISIPLAGGPEIRRYTLRGPDGKVVRELEDSISGTTHTWTWTKDYVYRGGALLATVERTATGEERRHFHLDHLGTPRLITNDDGFVQAEHSYWPFGQDAPGSTADNERMKFTGHERDLNRVHGPELDYMHARYYSALWGRFLSVDPKIGVPANPMSWNRYTYALNTPVRAFDPDGDRRWTTRFFTSR